MVETVLSVFVWLELSLASTGFDPILVVPAAALTCYAVTRVKSRRRRLRKMVLWLLASPLLVFAGYIVVDEALYWLPYAYTERLRELTGLQRRSTGSEVTAASNFRYPTTAATISASRYGVRVIDADTIEVGSVKVRLNGIAAPERGHKAYEPGKRFVRKLVRRSRRVSCGLTGEVSYDRQIGYCLARMEDQLVDIQAEIVQAGLARDCRRYSRARYRRLENRAARALPLPGYCRRF